MIALDTSVLVWADRSERRSVAGNPVFDAQIAAVCFEHGARTLLTDGRELTRFPRLTVRPLDG